MAPRPPGAEGRKSHGLVFTYFSAFVLVQIVTYFVLHSHEGKDYSSRKHGLEEAATLPLNLWESAATSSSTKEYESPKEAMEALKALTTPSKPHKCISEEHHLINNTFVESSFDLSYRKIPKIIHQTSKSPCLTPLMKKRGSAVGWQEEMLPHGYTYVFHDDEAVERLLLGREWPEFPLMKQVVSHCTIHPTVKADLWRYVVLWEFGGIYTDIDTAPAFGDSRFHAGTLTNDTDAWMTVTYYGVLSQWHMVTSPRHPFMYYAIQYCLQSLMMQRNAEMFKPVEVTGPNLLIKAFVAWIRDGEDAVDLDNGRSWSQKPMQAGVYEDGRGHSLTVVGTRTTVNDHVRRDVLGQMKSNEYQQLKMTYNAEFHEPNSKWQKTNRSCVHNMMAALDT